MSNNLGEQINKAINDRQVKINEQSETIELYASTIKRLKIELQEARDVLASWVEPLDNDDIKAELVEGEDDEQSS